MPVLSSFLYPSQCSHLYPDASYVPPLPNLCLRLCPTYASPMPHLCPLLYSLLCCFLCSTYASSYVLSMHPPMSTPMPRLYIILCPHLCPSSASYSPPMSLFMPLLCHLICPLLSPSCVVYYVLPMPASLYSPMSPLIPLDYVSPPLAPPMSPMFPHMFMPPFALLCPSFASYAPIYAILYSLLCPSCTSSCYPPSLCCPYAPSYPSQE